MKTGQNDLDVFIRNRAALVTYAAGIVGCRTQAEDIVQEAFINYRLRRGAPSGRADGDADRRDGIARPLSYFYRVVRNAAVDWLRRPDARVPLADVSELERMPTEAATPEEDLNDREQLRVLADALDALPERTRLAFDMRRRDGLSLREIADRLDISVVRAHQLIKDAIRHGAAALDAQD